MNGRHLSVGMLIAPLCLAVALGAGLVGFMAFPQPALAAGEYVVHGVDGGGGTQDAQIGDDDQPTINRRRDPRASLNGTTSVDGEPGQPSVSPTQLPERSAVQCLIERVEVFIQLCLVLQL